MTHTQLMFPMLHRTFQRPTPRWRLLGTKTDPRLAVTDLFFKGTTDPSHEQKHIKKYLFIPYIYDFISKSERSFYEWNHIKRYKGAHVPDFSVVNRTPTMTGDGKHTTHQNGDWARRPSITSLSFETQHRTKENGKSRKFLLCNLNKNNKIYWRVEWKELIHINIVNSSYILYIVYAIADTIYAQLNEARKQFLSYVVTIFHLYHACILFYILYLIWLVVSTPRKNISQLGSLFPIYGKIKMFQTTNQWLLTIIIHH